MKKGLVVISLALLFSLAIPSVALATSQSKVLSFTYGKLTSNAWRGGQTTSGNTYQWNYQVSAVYTGNYKVSKIRTTWTGGASLRNSASFTLGASGNGVTVGAGSSWQTAKETKYWENSGGAKGAYWGPTNMVVAPSRDYRSGTVFLINTGKVNISGDARYWQISASI